MAFLHQRLNQRIEQGAQGGPSVPGRTKTYLPGGKLVQGFTASAPIHTFDVSYAIRRASDYQAILDIWYVVMFTPYAGFLFRDWRDYQLTTSNSRLTLISGSIYQINRVHSYGGVEVLRPIYKPVAGLVVTRTRGGTPSTATVTTDTTTGQVTVTGHVGGDTYTCTGEFDLPVTFTDDAWVSTLEGAAPNLLVVSQAIKLEEIRAIA